MRNGWVKLHRKIIENPVANKPNYLALWVWILLLANHQENKFMWNGETIIIKEGQLLCGRKELSMKSGISPSTVERILNYLENEHQIEQQKTNKFRVITVINWKEYQKTDNKMDNRWTTDGQQMDTIKKNKNEKNEKKDIAEINSAPKQPLNLLEDKQKHIQIIGLFAFKNGITFQDAEQQRSFIRRYLRPASDLKSYPIEKISSVMDWLNTNADYKWTLETVGKTIDFDLKNLTKKTQSDEDWFKNLK